MVLVIEKQFNIKEKKVSSKKRISKIFKTGGFLIFILLAVAIAVSVLIFTKKAEAEVEVYYPSTCLGSFINPTNAQGKPDLQNAEDFEKFNYDNSAVYEGGEKQIFCGNFQGEEIDSSKIKTVKLKFIWGMNSNAVNPGSITSLNMGSEDLSTDQVKDTPENENKKNEEVTSNIVGSDKKEEPSSQPALEGEVKDENIAAEKEEIKSDVIVDNTPSETQKKEEPVIVEEKNIPIAEGKKVTEGVAVIEESNDEKTKEEAGGVLENKKEEVSVEQKKEDSSLEDLSAETQKTIDFVEAGAVLEKESNYLFKVKYSLDGSTWNILSTIETNKLVNDFDLPLDLYDKLSNLQISIESSAEASNSKVYLDGMLVEVEYDEDIKEKLINFNESPLIEIKSSEKYSIFTILKDGKEELWLVKDFSSPKRWKKIADELMMKKNGQFVLKNASVFFLSADGVAIVKYDIDSDTYSGLTIDSASESGKMMDIGAGEAIRYNGSVLEIFNKESEAIIEEDNDKLINNKFWEKFINPKKEEVVAPKEDLTKEEVVVPKEEEKKESGNIENNQPKTEDIEKSSEPSNDTPKKEEVVAPKEDLTKEEVVAPKEEEKVETSPEDKKQESVELPLVEKPEETPPSIVELPVATTPALEQAPVPEVITPTESSPPVQPASEPAPTQ